MNSLGTNDAPLRQEEMGPLRVRASWTMTPTLFSLSPLRDLHLRISFLSVAGALLPANAPGKVLQFFFFSFTNLRSDLCRDVLHFIRSKFFPRATK